MRRLIPVSLLVLAAMLGLGPVSPASSRPMPGGPAAPSAALQSTSDFDADGAADLAIGSPGEPEIGFDAAGAVYALYGSSDEGLQSAGNQRLTQSDAVLGDPEADDNFGAAVAAGDFNGDGADDLAIGIPNEDAQNSQGDLVTDAGKINVLYGTAGMGLTTADNQLWSQVGPGTKGDPEEGDHFGSALAAGDFNLDGFDDIAIGLPDESVEGIAGAGSVSVMYGSPNGIQISSPDDQLWDQNAGGVEDDAEASDHFGEVLASGDFNQDGFADLAIGVPDENIGAISNAGAANVLYGTAAGLQVTDPADQFWHQDSTSVRDSAESSDLFASALVAGDFDADSFADLAIGIPREDVSGVTNPGAVAVLYGTAGGLQAADPNDEFWSQDTTNVNDVSEKGDWLGQALAAGDFNGDGFDDLAAGAPGELIGGLDDAGGITVLHGGASGLQVTSPADQFWHQNSTDVNGAAELDDAFGSALAAADFDPGRPGGSDLAIGVPDEGLSGVDGVGSVHILYSTAGGLQAGDPADQIWSQNSEGIVGDPEDGDAFGGSLAAAS
jgi:hypothetical protein